MKKIKLNTVVIIAAAMSIIGLVDAFYLSYARYTSSDIACSLMGGCNIVAASPYSVVFGMPLAYLGVLFYFGMLGLLLLVWMRVRIQHVKNILLWFTAFGVFSSIYFIYVQGVLIKAFCMYCLISAGITFFLLGLAFLLDKKIEEKV